MLSSVSLRRLKVRMFLWASLHRLKVHNTKKLFQSGAFPFTFLGRNPMGESLHQKKSLPCHHFDFAKFLTLHSSHQLDMCF
jgi:hypothetical protein